MLAVRGMRVLVIPDTQCAPGRPHHHLVAAGNYIAAKRPDVVVHLGDHWDLPSLSSHASRREAEGGRYRSDVEAGNAGLAALSRGVRKRGYSPKLYLLRGNHEDRIRRTVNEYPNLAGVLDEADLLSPGWQVVPFLKVLKLRGTWFSHYYQSPHSARPIGGTAANVLARVGNSCVQGHVQGLDACVRQRADGSRQRCLIAGSFYTHNEAYRGPQGRGEWRGLVMLHNFGSGSWSQVEIDLSWLVDHYGG